MKTLKIDFYGSEDAISVFKSFLENNQMSLENENAEDLSDIDSDDWLKKIKFKEKKATIKTSSFEYNQIENISEFLSGLAEENQGNRADHRLFPEEVHIILIVHTGFICTGTV